MFDLAINVDDYELNKAVLEHIAYSLVDGYRVLALNYNLNTIQDSKKINFLLKDEFYENIQKLSSSILLSTMTSYISLESQNFTKNDYRILKRVTINFDNLIEFNKLKSEDYDIISVVAKNDKFDLVCSELNIDMILISSTEKINFYSKKKHLLQAVERGVFIEFYYSDLLVSETRSQFISNFSVVMEILKGKNIVLSSGTQNFILSRSVYDIQCVFSTIFNLNKDLVRTFLNDNPENLVRSSMIRKFSKGIIKIEKNNEINDN